MAATTKLNKEVIEQFAIEVEDGLPINYCCDLFSISKSCYFAWIKQGEYDLENNIESLNAQFYDSIKKAYARFVKDSKRRIRNGESGWQGTAWWLERTNKQFVLSTEDANSIEPVVVNPGMSKKNELKR